MGLKTLGHFKACQLLLRAQCFGGHPLVTHSRVFGKRFLRTEGEAVNHVIVGCDLFSSLFERTMKAR